MAWAFEILFLSEVLGWLSMLKKWVLVIQPGQRSCVACNYFTDKFIIKLPTVSTVCYGNHQGKIHNPPCKSVLKYQRGTNTQIKEHKVAYRLAKFESSAVAEHTWLDRHIIEWDQVEIVDTATSTSERLVKKAIHQAVPSWMQNQQRRRNHYGWMPCGPPENTRCRTTPSLQSRPPTTLLPRIVRPTPTLRRCRMSHATDNPTMVALGHVHWRWYLRTDLHGALCILPWWWTVETVGSLMINLSVKQSHATRNRCPGWITRTHFFKNILTWKLLTQNIRKRNWCELFYTCSTQCL